MKSKKNIHMKYGVYQKQNQQPQTPSPPGTEYTEYLTSNIFFVDLEPDPEKYVYSNKREEGLDSVAHRIPAYLLRT